ncbi:MAG: hypothetical protein Q7J42_17110 [Sulfuritalea sp.]|nr:hypothetical protein [Sulfuritalea sp.]
MEFIETPTFTRLITSLLSDDEFRELQNEIVEDPERGDLIKGGGGIRKLRYGLQGRGKSGGIRVIYYWVKDNHLIYSASRPSMTLSTSPCRAIRTVCGSSSRHE